MYMHHIACVQYVHVPYSVVILCSVHCTCTCTCKQNRTLWILNENFNLIKKVFSTSRDFIEAT